MADGMTATTASGGVPGIIAEMAFELVTRVAPKGLAWISVRLTGKKLLIVGPKASGKTSLIEYLRWGILEPDREHQSTLEVRKTPTFSVRMGKEGNLVLNLKKAIDTPGQWGPHNHSTLVVEHSPDAVVVVLDSSAGKEECAEWLETFCSGLESKLMENPAAKKKLKKIFVALNKRDKITAREYDRLTKAARRKMIQCLSTCIGRDRTKRIPIVPTVMVKNPAGTMLVDELIRTIAKGMIKNG